MFESLQHVCVCTTCLPLLFWALGNLFPPPVLLVFFCPIHPSLTQVTNSPLTLRRLPFTAFLQTIHFRTGRILYDTLGSKPCMTSHCISYTLSSLGLRYFISFFFSVHRLCPLILYSADTNLSLECWFIYTRRLASTLLSQEDGHPSSMLSSPLSISSSCSCFPSLLIDPSPCFVPWHHAGR